MDQLVGDSRSAVKGTGFEFDQLREYQAGDDVRYIDWRSSARINKLMIKQYIEERSRTILIALDVSSSIFFSSTTETRYDVLTTISAVISLVAQYGNDRVGLILFADKIIKYIPPGTSRMHAHSIIEAIFTYQEAHSQTDLKMALEYIISLKRKNALVFILSDFIAERYEEALAIAAKIYDLVVVKYLDEREKVIPAVGFVRLKDSESGQECMVNTRGRNTSSINNFLAQRITMQENIFKKYGVDILNIQPNTLYIRDFIYFFRRRMRY